MRLNSDELVTLTDKVINKITMDLFIANQSDELDVYLKNIGYEEDMPTYNNFYDYRNAKILIVGDCQYNSLISMIESNPERYPKLIKAISGQELKITKSSIEEALKKTQQYLSLIDY